MNETAIVEFRNLINESRIEIEVPLDITANDLVLALNEAFLIGMDTDNIFSCYLIAENPIAFLRGNKSLREFGIRNGTLVIYQRS